jgi:hypothetical protein
MRRAGLAVGLAALLIAVAVPAYAGWGGDATAGGSRLSFYERKELQQIKKAAAEAVSAKAAKRYDYASVANCGSNTPDTPVADDFCNEAILECAGNSPDQGVGPSVRLFRRQVDAAGKALGPWIQYGLTCFPQDAPGAPARPMLTMNQILAAFHDTDFAKPTVNIQPKGNVTLVRLQTYFALQWPTAGFQPGEVDHPDPARMLGYQVDIEPVLRSVDYVYGDGSSSGPTTSLGGPYPSGDVHKAYERAGDFPVRADVRYGGRFRVAGGDWIDIPGEVTIRGVEETLAVKTAHARLVTN